MSRELLLNSLLALDVAYHADIVDLTEPELAELGGPGLRVTIYRSDKPGWARGSVIVPQSVIDDATSHPDLIQHLTNLLLSNAEINKPTPQVV